ncbi:MAG: nucleotidyl transferase AbiEii/AbiGii toxin family protein [Actinomycetota bacterium]
MKAFDPLGALRALIDHDVDFVLIGGLAARLHGSPTVTMDLDICHSKERANLEALAECLRAMNARLRLPDPEERVKARLDWRMLHAGNNFTFTTDFGPLDCLAMPSGTESYDALSASAKRMRFEGIAVKVASLDDLMAMKKAAGRGKDLIELEILAALKEELER